MGHRTLKCALTIGTRSAQSIRARGVVFTYRKNIEAAKKAHGPAFQEGIQSIFGAKPEFQYFEAPIVIDNSAKEVIDNAA